MKIVVASGDTKQYPELVTNTATEVRMKLGMSRISLNSLAIPGGRAPVLLIDCFNEKGKLYSLRYHLPADTVARTDRRISLLLRLLRKQLGADSAALGHAA